MKTLDYIKRAQAIRLSGVGSEDSRHPLQPYVALGATQSPSYDFSLPGAVTEVKRALVALALKEALDHTDLSTDDVWDAETALEFALMVGRHRSRWPWALSDPFMSDAPYPSSLQPTVNGLELLAGAANAELDKTSKLSTYETWRGGAFAPPSVISRPPPTAGIRPTYAISPRTFVPSDAPADLAAAVGALDTMKKQLLLSAIVANSEPLRAEIRSAYGHVVDDREQAVAGAIQGSDLVARARADCQGASGQWDDPSETCTMPGRLPASASVSGTDPTGAGVLVMLGLVGAGLYFVLGRK